MRKIRNAIEPVLQAASPMAKCAPVFGLLILATPASAQHACDPVTDEGWRVVASTETTGVKDGAPYRVGGDWFVDRTTTLLPLCNYFNAIGNYSLRSYSLDPFENKERVAICRDGKAVAPYTGRCPPE